MYIMVGTAGLFPVGRMLASNSQQTVPSMLNLIPHNSTLFNNWRVSRSGRIRRYLGPCSQTPLDMGNYTQGYGRNGFTSHGSVSSASGTDETGLHSLIQDLDMPEIDADLSDRQSEQGALFGVRVQLQLRFLSCSSESDFCILLNVCAGRQCAGDVQE